MNYYLVSIFKVNTCWYSHNIVVYTKWSHFWIVPGFTILWMSYFHSYGQIIMVQDWFGYYFRSKYPSGYFCPEKRCLVLRPPSLPATFTMQDPPSYTDSHFIITTASKVMERHPYCPYPLETTHVRAKEWFQWLPKRPNLGKKWPPLPALTNSQSCQRMQTDARERVRGLR